MTRAHKRGVEGLTVAEKFNFIHPKFLIYANIDYCTLLTLS